MLAVGYRRFGTAHQSQIQGSRNPRKIILEHGTDTLSRNFGNQQKPTPSNITEERRHEHRRGGSLKSFIGQTYPEFKKKKNGMFVSKKKTFTC